MPLANEDRPSDSPYIHRVWRSHAFAVARMTSIATSNWELVFSDDGSFHAAVRGPETTATTVEVPDGSESFGITFAHGTSMPHLPPGRLVDSAVASPHATATRFVLRGDEWLVPDFHSAEQFIARLVREGVVVRDPLVDEAVAGGVPDVGTRSVQRRVAAATGLTRGSIRQIERARQAAILLGEGAAALDVVHRLGQVDVEADRVDHGRRGRAHHDPPPRRVTCAAASSGPAASVGSAPSPWPDCRNRRRSAAVRR